MCAVSMVTDVSMQRWPNPYHVPWVDYSFIKELIRKAEEYDRMTGQPDCPSPDKAKWWKDLQEYKERPVKETWLPKDKFTLNSMT